DLTSETGPGGGGGGGCPPFGCKTKRYFALTPPPALGLTGSKLPALGPAMVSFPSMPPGLRGLSKNSVQLVFLSAPMKYLTLPVTPLKCGWRMIRLIGTFLALNCEL